MSEPFRFELVSPERLLVSEDVESVVVPGAEGDFMVLVNHAPVLSTLRPGLLEVTYPGGRTQTIFVRGGFAEAGPDRLTVLAQLAVDVAELDRTVFTDQIKEAETLVAEAKEDHMRDRHQTALDQLRSLENLV
jgi:F-type H+-transporting ATPase subunit epsilon